jgi:hypothetical protein
MSSLLVFNRVYRLEIQSVMLVVPTPLVLAPLYLLSSSPTPPLPCVNKYRYIHSIQCVRGGGLGYMESIYRSKILCI